MKPVSYVRSHLAVPYRKESSGVLSSVTLTKHALYIAVVQRHDAAADERRRWRRRSATDAAAPRSHRAASSTVQQPRLGVHQYVREQEERPFIHSANTAAFWNLDRSSNTCHASISRGHSVKCIPPPCHSEITTVSLLVNSMYISLQFPALHWFFQLPFRFPYQLITGLSIILIQTPILQHLINSSLVRNPLTPQISSKTTHNTKSYQCTKCCLLCRLQHQKMLLLKWNV